MGVYYAYPSGGNSCYRDHAAVPLLEHQSAYCLGAAYPDCPVFKQAEGGEFPAELRAGGARQGSRRLSVLRWLAAAIGLGLVALAAWRFLPPYLNPPPEAATQPAAEVIVIAPSETVTAAAATSSPAPTQAPMATDTTVPQMHGLEAAIKVGGVEFRIHRMQWGETFESLAATYMTTPEVIRALNYELYPPLRAESVIVVAPGMQTPDASLPALRTYEVTAEGTTLEAVAQELGVNAKVLGHYNGCEAGCPLGAGDWLIVPVTP